MELLKFSSVLFFLTFGLLPCLEAACPLSCTCTYKTVDCSGRALTSVPADIPVDTQILRLNNNKLTLVGSELSKFKQLQELYLQGNQIQVLSEGTIQGLSSLKLVNLTSNKLREIARTAFKETTAHESCSRDECFIDLRNNPITVIRRYAFFWTSGFSIYIGNVYTAVLNIENHAFYGTGVIPTFHMENVSNLTLANSLFTDSKNISEITFVNVNLTDIQKYTFKGVINLESVKFINCSLLKMQEKAFSGTQFIQKLTGDDSSIEFRNCNIDTLAYEAFSDTSVQSVIIRKSRVKQIQPFLFRGNPSLNNILFENSSLPSILTGTFSFLDKLKSIRLKGNRFPSIAPKAFAESSNIELLSITGSFEDKLIIQDHSFNDLWKVKLLEIGAYKEVTFYPDALRGMVDIKVLKVYNTTIPEVRIAAFSGLTRISKLHLHNVQIKFLEGSEALNPVVQQRGISELLLEQVSLPCNCDMVRALRNSWSDSNYARHNLTCSYKEEKKIDPFVVNQLLDECRTIDPGMGGTAPGSILNPLIVYIAVILCISINIFNG